MVVTFIANARILEYHRGNIYRTELTPLLAAILRLERHLTLLDPLALEEDDDGPEGNPTPAISESSPRQDNGNGTAAAVGDGPDTGESTSTPVGRDKKLHGRQTPPDEWGTLGREPTTSDDNPEREESNSN